MQKQSVIQNIKWLAGANLVAKPVWFIFLLATARFLGPEEFGKYMFAIAYVSVVAVICEGGVDIHSLRRLSSRPEEFSLFFSHTSFLKGVSGLLVGLVAYASTYFVEISSTERSLIGAAIAYSAFNSMMIHARFVFRAFEIMKYEAYSMFFEKSCVILICGIALIARPGAQLFTVSYAVAYCLACVATFSLLAKQVGLPHETIRFKYLWNEVVRPALPYALMGFFMIIYFRSGTLMIKALTGREDLIGYYNAGYRLVEAFILFPTIIVSPLYPTFARNKDDKQLLRPLVLQATRVVGLGSIIISIPIFTFREEFTQLFFGAGFSEASPAVGIISLAMIPVGLTWVFGSLVAAIGRQGKANVLIFCVTALNLCLHLLLIPRLGLIGAAVSTFATEVAMAVACIWVVRDYLEGPEMLSLLGKALAPAVFIYACKAFGFAPNVFLVALSLSAVIMVSAYIYFGIITVADIRRLISRA